MVSEACTISQSVIATPVPRLREKLNVRPDGFTGRRRLPAFIDWDELERVQVKHGISEYCAVRILGYSLTSFYRHKKLRKEGKEKPYVPPTIIENDVEMVEDLQRRTGWTQRACIKHLGIPNTTFFKHKKMRDEGIELVVKPGALSHRDETNDERVQRYLNSRKFMQKRKCRHNPNPKPRTWKPVVIDLDAIDELQRKTWIPRYHWLSRHQCALLLGYSSSSYYRKLKEMGDKSRYDYWEKGYTKNKTVRLEHGFMSVAVSEL